MTARSFLVLAAMLLAPAVIYLLTPSRAPVTDKAAVVEARYQDTVVAKFADVPEISAAQLLKEPADIVLVDVRSAEEQAVSMIPGAVRSAVVERDLKAYEGKTLVTYCTIGYRSALFARDLRHQGLQAQNLHGGVLAWTHAGGGLDVGGVATRELHVWGPEWDLAPEGIQTTW